MDVDGIGSGSPKFSPRQCISVSDGLSFDPHPSTKDLKWTPVLEAPAPFGAYHVRCMLAASFYHHVR